jgi:Transposase IS4
VARTGRIVAADSYFASVESAEGLHKAGLRFIGVVQTATRRYPMFELSRIEFGSRGDRVGSLSLNEAQEPWNMAFTWVDRDRRYFMSTRSSLPPATPYTQNRLQQVSMASNAPPEVVKLSVPQSQAAEIYYSACAMIDRHNWCRQDKLRSAKLEFGLVLSWHSINQARPVRPGSRLLCVRFYSVHNADRPAAVPRADDQGVSGACAGGECTVQRHSTRNVTV